MSSNELFWFANDLSRTYVSWDTLLKAQKMCTDWVRNRNGGSDGYYSIIIVTAIGNEITIPYRSWEAARDNHDRMMKDLLSREKQESRDRLDVLEEKVSALWVAPNMPGSVEAQEHFNESVGNQ